jgi:predicted RNA-binding Zn ribbon-like protein
MATGHPLDSQRRVLPRCDWPADRNAPGALETVRRFCNTTNLESGADRLTEPEDFAAWLSEQGHDPFTASTLERDRCIGIRESLRDAATSHRSGNSDLCSLADLEQLIHDIRFVVGIDAAGLQTIVDPQQGPVAKFAGSIALAVTDATANGTWQRLKSCRHCRWVVYDNSKNRSAQWCSMSACGGRSKVQRHRARHHAAADEHI